MRFRLLDTLPAAGAWNMALDAALMESVRAGGLPVLRFYRWSPACLSLGRNQPARNLYDLASVRRRGWHVVRRPTGGRAVLHDRELTYAVIADAALLGGPRRSYAAINRVLLHGLVRLGVPAELQPGGRPAAAPSPAPCFGEPAEGEVVAGGRKLVGSAQYRERGVLLQHGSLLLRGDQSDILGLLREAPPTVPPEETPPATLSDFLDPLPEWDVLVGVIACAWRQELAARLEPCAATGAELLRAAELARHFADPIWTWRC